VFPRYRTVAACAAAAGGLCLSPLHAQTIPPATAPTPSLSAGADGPDDPPPLSATPTSGPPAPWQPLANRGVTLSLTYTGEFASNPIGGLRHGREYAGRIWIGGDFDLDRIAGISGGAAHVVISRRYGGSLAASSIDNNTSVQGTWAPQKGTLSVLAYEQSLFNGALVVQAGREVANLTMLVSPLYCAFESNAICGNPTFPYKVSNLTYFPAASWGGHATVHASPRLFAHVGVYEVNPTLTKPDEDGLNFSMKDCNGAIIPFEMGYAATPTDRMPGHYIVGGWIDRGAYADPLRDDQGGIVTLSGRPGAIRRGRSALYVRFDQKVTAPDTLSDRGLSVFGVAMVNVSGRVSETSFLGLGFLQTGTFKGRDADTLGFVVTEQRLSDLTLEGIRAARMKAGGSPRLPRHEYMMELGYGIQLNRATRIEPNLQYILHPDQAAEPSRMRDIPNALVIGMKMNVDLLEEVHRWFGH
jgi:porin